MRGVAPPLEMFDELATPGAGSETVEPPGTPLVAAVAKVGTPPDQFEALVQSRPEVLVQRLPPETTSTTAVPPDPSLNRANCAPAGRPTSGSGSDPPPPLTVSAPVPESNDTVFVALYVSARRSITSPGSKPLIALLGIVLLS